nr:von Willebrand factor type A domain-containing protein [Planctomycetota bacterium]
MTITAVRALGVALSAALALLLPACAERSGFQYDSTPQRTDHPNASEAGTAPGVTAGAVSGEGGHDAQERLRDPHALLDRIQAPTPGQEPQAPASAGHERGPLLARDLGDGANGEKLGRPRVAVEERAMDQRDAWRFTRTDQAGGDASTFGTDVDTASYTQVRAVLADGRLPDPGIVRIEEMLNAFHYDYQRPSATDAHPFAISTDVVPCPWQPAHRLARIAIAGRDVDAAQRPPVNLVFLIDVSGSMSADNRLPLLKRAFTLLVDQLDGRDHVAIVTYAGRAGIALPPTSGAERGVILRAIDGLRAGGSTNGEAGIAVAYRVARLNFARGAANRVILATDGDFNVGATGSDDLLHYVRREANAGIGLTALGVGMGNERNEVLRQLADQGNGIHAYLDSDAEARRLFVTDLPASLVTIAQDAKVQVFFNPGAVAAWRLLGYEKRALARRDFNDDRVDAGDLGAGHTVTALYELVPATAIAPAAADANPFVAEARPALVREVLDPSRLMRVRLRYQPPGGGDSRLLESDVADRIETQPERETAWAAAVAG